MSRFITLPATDILIQISINFFTSTFRQSDLYFLGLWDIIMKNEIIPSFPIIIIFFLLYRYFGLWYFQFHIHRIGFFYALQCHINPNCLFNPDSIIFLGNDLSFFIFYLKIFVIFAGIFKGHLVQIPRCALIVKKFIKR